MKTMKVYLFAVSRVGCSDITYAVSESKMDSISDYTIIGEREVEFETLADKEVTAAIVSGLDEKILAMKATANAAITEVQNTRASFLALEHKDVP